MSKYTWYCSVQADAGFVLELVCWVLFLYLRLKMKMKKSTNLKRSSNWRKVQGSPKHFLKKVWVVSFNLQTPSIRNPKQLFKCCSCKNKWKWLQCALTVIVQNLFSSIYPYEGKKYIYTSVRIASKIFVKCSVLFFMTFHSKHKNHVKRWVCLYLSIKLCKQLLATWF